MPIRIENKSSRKLPAQTESVINSALDVLPREHQRGLTRLVLVDQINPDPRLMAHLNAAELPGLYHPRVGNEQPWLEVAVNVLLPRQGFFKQLAARLNYKLNLVSLLMSLVAQHYHLSFSHGVKKNQYERAVRAYIDKYFAIWRERNAGWRAKLFKPVAPYLEKMSRKLKQKYEAEQRRAK